MTKPLIFLILATLFITGVTCLSGCSGGAENSVAAPPENPPTDEALEAQSQAYAAQEQEMRLRDRRN